eukprot:Nk52_evm24s2612 gene=Nk52_evmTU24s2612
MGPRKETLSEKKRKIGSTVSVKFSQVSEREAGVRFGPQRSKTEKIYGKVVSCTAEKTKNNSSNYKVTVDFEYKEYKKTKTFSVAQVTHEPNGVPRATDQQPAASASAAPGSAMPATSSLTPATSASAAPGSAMPATPSLTPATSASAAPGSAMPATPSLTPATSASAAPGSAMPATSSLTPATSASAAPGNLRQICNWDVSWCYLTSSKYNLVDMMEATAKEMKEVEVPKLALSDIDAFEDLENDSERQSSVTRTVVNQVAAMIGLGILGLPNATALSGWLFGGIFLVLSSVFAGICSILISDCMLYGNPVKVMKTYAELGEYAFGKVGKWVTHICVYATCVGASLLYLIIANDMAKSAFGENVMSDIAWSVVNASILFPLIMLKNYNTVYYIGLLGVIGSVVSSVMCLVLVIIEISDRSDEEAAEVKVDMIGDDFLNVVTAFSTFVYSFGAAALFPEMLSVMAKPQRFNFAVLLSFMVTMSMYAPMAFVCYFVLGKDRILDPSTEGNVVKALGDSTATQVLYIFVWIAVMASFVVFLIPVFRSVEMGFQTHVMSEKKELLFRVINRFLWLLLCWFISVLIPFFGDVMSLLGATSVTGASFLIPLSCWFKLRRADYMAANPGLKGWLTVTSYIIIFLFAVMAGAVSAYTAMENIISSSADYKFFL